MAETVKVKVPTGKIRQDPRPDGRVLLELQQGQELKLVEHQLRYSQVRYRDHFQDVTGWIANVAINLPEGPSKDKPASPKCPFCGSETWIAKGIRTGGGSSFTIGGLFAGHYVHSRICLGCGYVQLHVSPRALQQLQEEYERQRRE